MLRDDVPDLEHHHQLDDTVAQVDQEVQIVRKARVFPAQLGYGEDQGKPYSEGDNL